jgi:opacity protein-like surface antigen
MKGCAKQLLRAFISLSVAQSASAADMSVKAPVYTPAMAAPWSWTGFYLGGHIGAAFASTDIADPLGIPIYGDNVRSPGFIGGGQIGFNYQLGSIVFGVEADASWVDSDGTNTCFAVSGTTASSNCRVRPDLYATVTGRLGYAVDRSLFYVKGGAAWTHGTIDMFVNQNNAGVFTSTNSFATPGWTVGGGVEYALTPAWSVKLEYDYLNFGGQDVATPYVAGNPFGIAPTTTISQHVHQAKLGLNYRFGPGAENWPASLAAIPMNPTAINATAGWQVEAGARTMYSWGRFQKDHGTGRADGSTLPNGMVTSRLTYDDMRTDSSELFGRIDSPWNVFLKGYVGVGFTGSGNQTDEDSFVLSTPPRPAPYSNSLSDKVNGHLNYAVVDLGYDFLRGPSYKAGAFVGYSFLDQFMNRYNCVQIANPTGSCEPPNQPPTPPNVVRFQEIDKWQSLRVGVAGETMLADRLKLSGEVAYLPYVRFEGLDNHFRNPVAPFPASSNGGRGVQTEAQLSYYLTDRFAVGIGARYWALWTTNGEFTAGNPPGPPRYYRASFEQAGVFVQTSYTFGGDSTRAYASTLPYKAAPAGAHYDWSGLYAGFVGGGEWGRSKHINNSNDITPTFDVNGALLGASVGYNAQFAGIWLFGLEGDMSWSDASGNAFYIPPFNRARQGGTKELWLGTARIRLGVTPIEHWLTYITGGVALAEVEAEIFNPEATYTERHVRGGWTAGAGVEYAMTKNWSAKLEYLHVGLTDTSYFTPAPAATTSNRGAGVPLDEDIVRGGINYKFFQ